MTAFIAAQIIGAIGVLIAISVFQANKRPQMLKLGILASVFHIAQFILLGAYTGVAMHLIGGLRTYTFFKVKPNKHHVWILIFFLLIAVFATFVTWQGPISLLALAGNMCGGIATWQKKPKLIRRWALGAPPFWFTYNALNGAIPGMILEVIMLTSNLIGEYRYDFKHKYHARRRYARPA